MSSLIDSSILRIVIVFLKPILSWCSFKLFSRFSVDELRQIATSGGVRVESFHEFLDKLNHQVS